MFLRIIIFSLLLFYLGAMVCSMFYGSGSAAILALCLNIPTLTLIIMVVQKQRMYYNWWFILPMWSGAAILAALTIRLVWLFIYNILASIIPLSMCLDTRVIFLEDD